MKTFIQHMLARMGLWNPVIGAVYHADEKFVPDPFNPTKKRKEVKVLDIREGFVKFQYLDFESEPTSSSIVSFGSYYLRNKP